MLSDPVSGSDAAAASPLPAWPTDDLRRLEASTSRVVWSAERVRRGYCQRSLAELQSSGGEINFCAPCADLSLLFAASIWDRSPVLVLTFVCRPKQHIKFQGSVEVATEAGLASVGFSETAIQGYIGRAETSASRPLILRHELKEPAKPKKSFLHYFHSDGLRGLRELFSGYEIETDLRWHCARNRRWRLWWTAWRAGRKSGPTVITPVRRFQY